MQFRKLAVSCALIGSCLVTSGTASAATTTPNALPAGLSPAVTSQALQAGYPNPAAPPIVINGVSLPGGGVQIDANSVAYQNGTAVLTVPSAATSSTASPAASGVQPLADVDYACGSNRFCLYRDAGYGTPQGSDYFYCSGPRGETFDLSAYGFNDVDSSWRNNRSAGSGTDGNVRVYNDYTNGSPTGDYFVANPNSASPSIGSYNDDGSGVTLG